MLAVGAALAALALEEAVGVGGEPFDEHVHELEHAATANRATAARGENRKIAQGGGETGRGSFGFFPPSPRLPVNPIRVDFFGIIAGRRLLESEGRLDREA
jgi:hypothetical protein